MSAFALCVAGAAAAATAQYTVVLDGQTRTLQMPSADVQGISYVPLNELMRQLGGACDASAARVQLELAGRTALIGVNNTRVITSQLEFSLAYPVILREGGAWIAQADLDPVLAQAFQLKTQPADPTPQVEPSVDLDADMAQALATPPIALPQTPVPPQDAGAVAEAAAAAPPIETPAPPETSQDPPGPAQTVLIDPGHGGDDPGSVGPGGLLEKDVALAVAQQLRRILKENSGAKALMTRDQDRAAAIADRVNQMNQQKKSIFVSIHAGVSFANQAHGFDLFCPAQDAPNGVGQQSRALAAGLAQSIAAGTGAECRGIHEAPLRLFRDMAMPGILIEIGMLSNPAEEALLGNEAYQAKLAGAIAQGLKPFLQPPEKPGVTP